MQDAKPGSHTIWDCKYHIVWIAKDRCPVLGGDVGQRARELLLGNRAGARDDDLRWSDQSRPRAYADRDTAASVGVSRGAVSQGEEFAQTAVGISIASQTVLGSASLGSGLLGCHERQRDGRGVEEIY